MASQLLRTLVFFFFSVFFGDCGIQLQNLDCQLRPAVVETRSGPDFEYFPFYVSLHRCSGSKGKTSPLIIKCVPKTIQTLRIRSHPISNTSEGVAEVVNHTSCTTECVLKRSVCKPPSRFDEKSCKCICDVGIVGPFERQCKDPKKIWNEDACGCICKDSSPCKDKRKYFDHETCSCRCKRKKSNRRGRCSYDSENYNEITCSCNKTSKSTSNQQGTAKKRNHTIYWLSAVAVEFILMFGVFEAFLYSKNSGLLFSHKAAIVVTDRKEDKEMGQTKDRVTYKDILRRHSVIRNRSSRTSSAHHGPNTPFAVTSPSYDHIAEDVFFNE